MATEVENRYRKLEKDSSDLLMKADNELVQGRMVNAAYFALTAGYRRFEMGQLMDDLKNFAAASEDWLSSAACFIKARAPKQIADPLFQVSRLANEGRIPLDREDILHELQARQREERRLRGIVRQFYTELAGIPSERWSDGLKRYKCHWLPRLTGFAQLHYLIYRAAVQKDRDLGLEHLNWACMFDQANPNFAGLLGYELLASDRSEHAIKVGNRFVDDPPARVSQVLIMLSVAYSSMNKFRDAIEVLQCVVSSADARPSHKIAAVALSATYALASGDIERANSLIRMFETYAKRAKEWRLVPVVKAARTLLGLRLPTGSSDEEKRLKADAIKKVQTTAMSITISGGIADLAAA